MVTIFCIDQSTTVNIRELFRMQSLFDFATCKLKVVKFEFNWEMVLPRTRNILG